MELGDQSKPAQDTDPIFRTDTAVERKRKQIGDLDQQLERS